MSVFKSDPFIFCDILKLSGAYIAFQKDENKNIVPYIDYSSSIHRPRDRKFEVPFISEPSYANDKLVGYASAFIRIDRDDPFIRDMTQYLRFGVDIDITANNACFPTLNIVDVKFDASTNKIHDVYETQFNQFNTTGPGGIHDFFNYVDEHFREYDHIYHIGGELKTMPSTGYRLTDEVISRQKLVIKTNI